MKGGLIYNHGDFSLYGMAVRLNENWPYLQNGPSGWISKTLSGQVIECWPLILFLHFSLHPLLVQESGLTCMLMFETCTLQHHFTAPLAVKITVHHEHTVCLRVSCSELNMKNSKRWEETWCYCVYMFHMCCIYVAFSCTDVFISLQKNHTTVWKVLFSVDSPSIKALGTEGGRSRLCTALCIAVTLILHWRRWTWLNTNCREDRTGGRDGEEGHETETAVWIGGNSDRWKEGWK